MMGEGKVSLAKLQEMVVFSPEITKAAHDAEAEYWEGINSDLYNDGKGLSYDPINTDDLT